MLSESRGKEKVLEVARALELDIVLGRLYPRERLVEEHLVKRFASTRHVIRQALNELEGAGLLVRETNKGTAVCEYSAEEVNQLYQMREFVERQAALLIPLPISAANVLQLQAICARHAQAIEESDMLKVVAANKEFHQVLFRLCGNNFLADVIDDMAKKSNLVRFTIGTDFALLKQARDEHFQILAALQGRDNARLAEICVQHIQPSRLMYLQKRGHRI